MAKEPNTMQYFFLIFTIVFAIAILYRFAFPKPNTRYGPPQPPSTKFRLAPLTPITNDDGEINEEASQARKRFLQWLYDTIDSQHYQDSPDSTERALQWHSLAIQESSPSFWLASKDPLNIIGRLENWS